MLGFSPNVLTRQTWRDGTYTDQNHLANFFGQTNSTAMPMAWYMATQNNNMARRYTLIQDLLRRKSLVDALRGRKTSSAAPEKVLSGAKAVGTPRYHWSVYGDPFRTLNVMAVPTPADNVGRNFQPFILPLDMRYFHEGCMIRFESGMQARVTRPPEQRGSLWCYTCILDGNDPEAFLPPTDYAYNARVSVFGTSFEEASEGGGSFGATTYAMWNQMGIHRTRSAITGSAMHTVMQADVEVPDPNTGKKLKDKVWMTEREYWQMLWHHIGVEGMLLHSKWNVLPDGTIPHTGTNGNPVYMFSGIEQQMRGVHYKQSSTLRETDFFDLCLRLQDNSRTDEVQNIVIVTGNGGFKMFQQMLEAKTSSLAMITSDLFVKRVEGAELMYGSYFTHYQGPGFTFTIVNHPMLNNKALYPGMSSDGWTLQSYRMYMFDLSSYEGMPSIQLVTRGFDGRDRGYVQWYTAGSHTPTGITNEASAREKMLRSHGRDTCECYSLSEFGVQLARPETCAIWDLVPRGAERFLL